MKWIFPWSVWLALLSVLTACQAVLTPVPTPTLTPTAELSTSLPPVASPASEVFLTPIAPTPTFTPVPTPTPVIYTVQSGDTFLGIALEYGVSLDALLKANGLSVDEFLHVGQALIIPMDASEESRPVAPVSHLMLNTPTPLPLNTSDVALYQTPVGGIQCLGTVLNTSDTPVTNLQLQVVLVSPDGTPLAEQTALAAADYLPPGERAPFAVLFPDPPDGVAEARAQLLRGEPIGPVTEIFTPLAVLEPQGNISGPQYRVTGQVSNQAGVLVDSVRIVVTVFDAEGRVLGYRLEALADEMSLAAGESYAFEVLVTPQGLAEPASFQVLAWGRKSG